MIKNDKSIYAYREYFKTDNCGFLEPGPLVSVYNEKTGKCHASPFKETDEEFMDRIERSKKAGRNLFFEEWEEFEYEEGMLY